MAMLGKGRVSLLSVVLASFGTANAAREALSVTEGGTTFTVARFDDGRNKPYRLKFKQDGTRSLYMFDSTSHVTNIKVGTERFEVLYDASDNLESVELALSTRRALKQEENDAVSVEGRRLEFADCADCEEGWESLCAGVSSVCDLVDYGSPFSATAAASVDTMCETFGSACTSYEASEACQDQCTEGEEEEEDEEVPGSSSNRCLSPTNADYKCTFTGETTMKFTDCDLTDDDTPYLPACFDEFGKTNVVELDLDESTLTFIPDGTFAGLSELTSLDLYSNKLTTVPEGIFSDLTKLEFLDMAYNDLVSLPEGAFTGLTSLITLRLFNNELTPETLPLGLFSTVPQLQSLYLSSNSLGDMTGLVGLFDGLTELRRLGLSEAGIQIVPEGLLAGLTKLEHLSFWINGISVLPDGLLSDLTALQTLELSDNSLTELGTSLAGLTELRTLLLEYNDLVLSEDSFVDLVNLEELDMYECGLTTLPAGLFSPMVNLVSLSLWGNDGLQCLPTTSATDVDLPSEDVRDGTCECIPAEAVSCDDGLTCQSGTAGYTCAA